MSSHGSSNFNPERLQPGTVFDKYEIKSFLGQGGMGRVFLANDTSLNRKVALKVVVIENPETRERFMREARHQAALDHQHICKVFEVGEVAGISFIALEYIEGDSLLVAGTRMNLEEKVLVIRDVANAIHVAHAQGLIHRDLKPENIMVKLTPDGFWKPYVMDFGLVREVSEPGLTMTGMVLGTPAYMPPEQALGELELLDRRSDIYSLGVTLYELLTGEKPFPGKGTTELLIQVVEDEPVSLRKVAANMPRDLENITMKCLEKEPVRRYENARLLARDLDNFLTGEPVLARHSGLMRRIYKRARKNKPLAFVSLSAMLVILIMTGLFWEKVRENKHQMNLRQRISAQYSLIDGPIREAYLFPKHDIRPQLKVARGAIAAISSKIDEYDRESLGMAYFAIGWGYLEMLELEEAEKFFKDSYNSGYQKPNLLWSYGRTLGRLYEEKLDELRTRFRNRSKAEFERELMLLHANYRDKAIEYLLTGLGGQPCNITHGLVAMYRENYEEALAHARSPSPMNFDYVYSLELEGDIHKFWGKQRKEEGQMSLSFRHFQDAINAYDKAADITRSNPVLFVSRLECLEAQMDVAERCGWDEQVDQIFGQAQQLAADGFVIDPESAIFHSELSRLCSRRFSYYNDKGLELMNLWDESFEHAQTAVMLAPQKANGYLNVAYAYYQLGSLLRASDQENLRFFATAAEFGDEALVLDPLFVEAHTFMGLLLLMRGNMAHYVGQDPFPFWEKALWHHGQIGQIDPNYDLAYSNSALVLIRRMEYMLDRGMAVDDDLALAFVQAQKALSYNDSRPFNLNMAAMVHLLEAMNLVRHGKNSQEALGAALTGFKASLDLAPGPYTWREIGRIYQQQAIVDVQQGISPEKDLELAVDSLENGWQMSRGLAPLHYHLASVYLDQTEWLLSQGRDVTLQLKRVAEILQSENVQNRLGLTILAGRAASLKMLADPENRIKHLDEAVACFQTAAGIDPQHPLIWEYLGDLYFRAFRLDSRQGYGEKGLEALDKAIQLNGFNNSLVRARTEFRQLVADSGNN